jgi:peptidoglycan hydrolase-like protein with peptidoglycan-binding domain
MTVKQRQHLLGFLGYYVGNVDGDWGQLSKTACKAFQKDYGLTADGIFGASTEKKILAVIASGEVPKTQTATGDFWDEIEFFDREEFRCKCGGKYCDGFPAEPKEAMVRIADKLRRNLGVPITIVSGLRCSQWNAIQGGVANSQHMYGEAADIYAKGVSQARVEQELDAIGGVRYHYPISGSNNVHFDIPKGAR